MFEDLQCEICGSWDVEEITEELFRCLDEECGEYFDVELHPRVETFRRKTRWEEDDDE